MAHFLAGGGSVPDIPLLDAVVKRLCELPSQKMLKSNGLPVEWPEALKTGGFSLNGVSTQELRDFFTSLLAASRGTEPIIESGNKYGVSDAFHHINGKLLMQECKASPRFQTLLQADKVRAEEFLKVVLLNAELRNRNPLHPSFIDSVVIGNLLNFPAHIFGFPFASYATDGNESLSLCLYSYREQAAATRGAPIVLYVKEQERTTAEPLIVAQVRAVAARLNMSLVEVEADETWDAHGSRVAVVMAAFSGTALASAASRAFERGMPMHVHVSDTEWRHLFTTHTTPVHCELHSGVRSLSIEHGLLSSGYSLYRDLKTRDEHFDVGHQWQTAYMSFNEGDVPKPRP